MSVNLDAFVLSSYVRESVMSTVIFLFQHARRPIGSRNSVEVAMHRVYAPA